MARAQSNSDLEEAKSYFKAGDGLYHLHRYREAADSFRTGYSLSKKPEFLINLGQSYRMQKHFREALDAFHRFISEAPAHARRAEVEQLIVVVEKEMAETPPAAPPPLLDPDFSPVPPPTTATVPPVSPSLPPPIIVPPVASPPAFMPGGRSASDAAAHHRRPWWIFGVVIGGAALIAGIVVAAIYIARAVDHSPVEGNVQPGVLSVGP